MKKKPFHIPHSTFRKKGFTLAEIIIVVGIAVMLTAILIVYTRGGEKQIIFFKEQSVLVSTLLRAKAFSIETFQPNLQPDIKPPDEIVCGWGVNFDKNNNVYTIFRDLAPDSDTDCTNANKKYDPTKKEKFEEFVLPKTTNIGCIGLFTSHVPNCSSSINNMDVVFIPPDPRTEFFPKLPNIREAIIELELDDKTRKSVIRVTRAGQISFK